MPFLSCPPLSADRTMRSGTQRFYSEICSRRRTALSSRGSCMPLGKYALVMTCSLLCLPYPAHESMDSPNERNSSSPRWTRRYDRAMGTCSGPCRVILALAVALAALLVRPLAEAAVKISRAQDTGDVPTLVVLTHDARLHADEAKQLHMCFGCAVQPPRRIYH